MGIKRDGIDDNGDFFPTTYISDEEWLSYGEFHKICSKCEEPFESFEDFCSDCYPHFHTPEREEEWVAKSVYHQRCRVRGCRVIFTSEFSKLEHPHQICEHCKQAGSERIATVQQNRQKQTQCQTQHQSGEEEREQKQSVKTSSNAKQIIKLTLFGSFCWFITFSLFSPTSSDNMQYVLVIPFLIGFVCFGKVWFLFYKSNKNQRKVSKFTTDL